MRTTVTLDADVERLLRTVMSEGGISFKKALNESIRAGLSRGNPWHARRYVQKSYSLGSEQIFRWDKALAVAEALEDEERNRKLPARKR